MIMNRNDDYPEIKVSKFPLISALLYIVKLEELNLYPEIKISKFPLISSLLYIVKLNK